MASAVTLYKRGKPRRKSPAGIATNDLVFTSYLGDNSEIFRNILSLYVEPGSKVADVTYGKGVFWRAVPRGRYEIFKTDLQSGVDFRQLPYQDASMACVVVDPPYMHTPGGTAHVNHQNYENYYRNNGAGKQEQITERKYHEAVLDLYFAAGKEALRVLKNNGFFIVKCGDEVCANRQRLTHVELIVEFERNGFVAEDLFILTRNNRPGVSRALRQAHARKNHSYFIVFRKAAPKSRWLGIKNRNLLAPIPLEEPPLFRQRTEQSSEDVV